MLAEGNPVIVYDCAGDVCLEDAVCCDVVVAGYFEPVCFLKVEVWRRSFEFL